MPGTRRTPAQDTTKATEDIERRGGPVPAMMGP
jgi:hypothetical protein